MSRREDYRRALDVAVAYFEGLGLRPTWVRWPHSPTAEDLDALPVGLRQVDEVHEVFFDAFSVGGTAWRDLEAETRANAVVALKEIKNLSAFSRETGLQYAILWRAKEGGPVPESVIEALHLCPKFVVRGATGAADGEDDTQQPPTSRSPLAASGWAR